MSDQPTHQPTTSDKQPTITTSSNRRLILTATVSLAASAGCLSSPFGDHGDGDEDDAEQENSNDISSTEPPDEDKMGGSTDNVASERNEEGDENKSDESNESDDEETQEDESDPLLTTYEDHTYGYLIDRPDSWELHQNDKQIVTFSNPDGSAELTITIYLAEGAPSLEDGADIVIANTEDEMDNIAVRELEQTTLDSGADAIDLELDYTHPDRGETRSIHRLVAIDHILYAAEFAVPLDKWEQHKDLVEAVITSLAITDPPSRSATDDVLADRETYDSDDFSIEYPAKWTVDERDNGDIHFQTDKARAGMVVASEPSRNQPLDEFVEAYRDEIEQNPDAAIVDQRDALQVANRNDAHLLVAELDDGETTARTFGLTTVGDGTVYYVTLEIPEPAHTTAAEDEIVQILTSLSF